MAVYDQEKEDTEADVRDIVGVKPGEEDRMDAAGTDGAREDLAAQEDGAAKGTNAEPARASSPQSLLGDESSAPQGPSLYKGTGGLPGGGGKLSGLKKARGFISRNKFALIGAGGTGLLAILVLVLLQLGSLIIPNFTQHMVAYEFARLSRYARNSASVVAAEKAALQSIPNSRAAAAFREMAAAKNNLLEKTYVWRPTKAAERFFQDVQYNYEDTRIQIQLRESGPTRTYQRLTSITLDGTTYPAPPAGRDLFTGRASPVSYARAMLQYRRDIKALTPKGNILQRALVRGKIAKQIRAGIDARLFRWTKSDVKKASTIDNEKARIEETRRSYNVSTKNGTSPEKATKSPIADVEEGAKEVLTEMNEDMADDLKVKEIINNGGGLSNRAISYLNGAFDQAIIKEVIGAINPTYAIAVPLCLMYQSSVIESGPVIDTNMEQSQRFGLSVASAGDAQVYTQLNDGDDRVHARLTGGLENQLNIGPTGTIYDSNVEKAARGASFDTSETAGPQTPPGGSYRYDIFDTFMPGGLSSVFSGIADPVCAVFTNIWAGGVIAIGSIAVSAIPGLGQVAASGTTITARIIATAVAKQATSSLAKIFTKKELKNLGLIITVTELGSLLAKIITMSHVGTQTMGTAQGKEAADLAHMGMDAYAQENLRKDYSVPLTKEQLAEVKEADTEYMNQATAESSVVQRYLNPRNPDSLMGRMAVVLYSHINIGAVAKLLTGAAKALNPFALPGLFSSLGSNKVHAITYNVSQTDYGIVQWGWSMDEEDAYMNNPAYAKFHNQLTLDRSGRTEEIAERYGKCFNDTMGNLLSSGAIQRDDGANIIDDPSLDCAPVNLGRNNTQGFGDLVFRWRVANRHNNALDMAIAMEGPE